MRREDPQITDLKERNPVRRLRRKLDMTQAELAVALDCSLQTISAIENGYPRQIMPGLRRGFKRIGQDADTLNREYLDWRKTWTERIINNPRLKPGACPCPFDTETQERDVWPVDCGPLARGQREIAD